MHTMEPFLFGLLKCPTCGRIVIPDNPNPWKWTEIVKGDRAAGHTAFIAEVNNGRVQDNDQPQ